MEKTWHIWHKETEWLDINICGGCNQEILDTLWAHFLTQPTKLVENN